MTRTAEEIGRTTAGPRPLPAARRSPARSRCRTWPTTACPTACGCCAAHRPGIPMVELRLRGARSPGADDARCTRPSPSCSPRPCSPAPRPATASTIDDELAARRRRPRRGGRPRAAAGRPAPGSPRAFPTCSSVLADVLTAATHPDAEVARERDRLVERITVARAQPRTIAREALQRKRFGDHPITREMPTEAARRRRRPRGRAGAAALRRWCRGGRSSPWSATSTRPRRDRRRREAARRLDGRRTGPGADAPAADRRGRTWSWCTAPARCSRSCGSPRPRVGRASTPVRRAAAGQPRVRRLLLLALDGEHPRGQGLHLRRALGRRVRARRRGAGRGDRRGQRRHRRRPAGDPLRAGPPRRRAADGRRRSTRRGRTRSGSLRSRWTARAAGLVHRNAMAADGLTSSGCAATRRGWRRSRWTRSRPRRCAFFAPDRVHRRDRRRRGRDRPARLRALGGVRVTFRLDDARGALALRGLPRRDACATT